MGPLHGGKRSAAARCNETMLKAARRFTPFLPSCQRSTLRDVHSMGGRGMRNPVTLGSVCIICLISLLVTDRMAFAQAGSTGGAIGKTDKSVSGGEEQTREPKTTPEARSPEQSSREDRCSLTPHPDRCRCALKTGGYIFRDPSSPTGYHARFPNRAAYLECMARSGSVPR